MNRPTLMQGSRTLALLAFAATAFGTHPAFADDRDADQLARGKYLVTVAASPTNTAWSGPWGVSFTANLTPDAETGLGKWTQTTFTQTIRTGRHMGRGRRILPPMPVPMYKNFTDEDLAAIFKYLQSIPPVKNRVPEPLPPAASAMPMAAKS